MTAMSQAEGKRRKEERRSSVITFWILISQEKLKSSIKSTVHYITVITLHLDTMHLT